MIKRLFLLALVAVSVNLVACSGGEKSEEPASTTASEAPAEAPAADASASEAAPADASTSEAAPAAEAPAAEAGHEGSGEHH